VGYGVIGCVEMGVQERLSRLPTPDISTCSKALENTLNNGVDPSPERAGFKNRRPLAFKSFEQLKERISHS
jgi:pyruvate-formate lyase